MAVRVTGGLVLDLAGGCRGFGFVCGTGSRVFRIETGSAAADEESRASLSGRRRFGGEGIVRRRGNPTPVDNGHAVDGGLGTLLFVKTDPPGRRPGRATEYRARCRARGFIGVGFSWEVTESTRQGWGKSDEIGGSSWTQTRCRAFGGAIGVGARRTCTEYVLRRAYTRLAPGARGQPVCRPVTPPLQVLLAFNPGNWPIALD